MLALGSVGTGAGQVTVDSVRFGAFGRIAVYRPAGEPTAVALFLSGDGGWNLGVVGMARELAGHGALVAGIDIVGYLRELERSAGACSYPAGDLETVAQFLERRARMPRYLPPVLVGYSSGATLAYAALAQAPAGSFAGALSLGFCPDLPLGKPLCRGARLSATVLAGRRGYRFGPAAGAPLPWIVLQGTMDQVCNADAARRFVSQVPGARIVVLPRVGHGFGVAANWVPQFARAFTDLASARPAAPPAAIADLPLIEVSASGPPDDRLAIVISGDGGWASLDRDVGNALAARGIPVVGWNSLEYFWSPRTPDGAGADLARVARHYLAAWNKRRLLLVGYSRGADVLPFMAGRLPDDLRRLVAEVALIAPSRNANFTFHPADLLLDVRRKDDLPVKPALERLQGLKVVCLYGVDDSDSVCRDTAGMPVRSVALPGGHHFGGRYEQLAALILEDR